MKPTLKLLAILPAMLFASCSTIVTTPPANCSEFIPPSWKVPVESAPLPKEDTAQGWQSFGVGQTGQLVKANGRQADTVHIVETCEKRANDARPRKKILGVF